MKNITYISASAGSGKTFELTKRLKEVILSGKAKAQEVILTTFTTAAASEFKEKAKAKFYESGNVKEANALDQALIGTVDSVANNFVNRYWYLLGLSPKLNVISKEDERLYVAESLSTLPSKEESVFFCNFADTFKIKEDKSSVINYDFWKDDLKKIFDEARAYDIKDFFQSIAASKKLIESLTSENIKLNFDREELLLRLAAIEEIICEEKESDAKNKRIEKLEKFKRIVNNPSKTQLEIGFALYEMTSIKEYTTKKYQENEDFNELGMDSQKVWICKEVRDMQFTYIDYIFKIAKVWQEKYAAYKKEKHIIDYIDMEDFFYKLITDDKYKCVQEDIKKTYKYLFVDEFQDSSPRQIKIFDRLSELVEESIWVGDYKQAIYGFRGSDLALVKAVTDRIENLNGRVNESLSTSHRSWPPLVDTCNKIFLPAFSDILRKEEVELSVWDKLEKEYNESNKKDCLKAWPLYLENDGKKTGSKAADVLASNIARMIKDENILPKDIAVLARTNKELTNIASALKEFNIPSYVGDGDFKNSPEIILLTAMLSLVVNPQDTMARSKIAFLTQDSYGAATILDEKIESIHEGKSDGDFLSEIPLIQKLLSKREVYKSLSLACLVENLIVEMDLYNVVKCWPDSDSSANIFATVIKNAGDYESHCIQMNLPCTIYGFIDYIQSVEIKSAGNSEGLQLFTYHGSKGLEWKNVILLSLNDDILEEKSMIRKNIYGIHTCHEVLPSKDDPYPPMIITLLPRIFSIKRNLPQNVKERLLSNPDFKKKVDAVLQEEKRLLYVAMTRPVERLVLTVSQKNPFLRLRQLGINALDSLPETSTCDLLGIGNQFVIEEPYDAKDWKFKSCEKMILNISGQKGDFKKRNQSPSLYKSEKKFNVKMIFDRNKRIPLASSNDEMDKVGTCIHDIFCVLEKNKDEDFVKKIILNHHMENILTEPGEILAAWNGLENFLTENYGRKIKSFHELPFKQKFQEQIFTGSIDLLWETEKGMVLVDYKSYPGNKGDVVDPSHKHYAAIYSPQMECYERALKAGGKNVLAKIIYYHVLGIAVELF